METVGLIEIPRDLARPRELGVKILGTERLIEALDEWKIKVVTLLGGNPAGALVANSLYRPAGTTCENDTDGKTDLSDVNGHWTGCAVDYSVRLTSWGFWGMNCPKWRRDDIRDTLVASGLYHPWYWVGGQVGGDIYEYWNTAIELHQWTQTRAYRGTPPHWYDGLRPGSTAIRTN